MGKWLQFIEKWLGGGQGAVKRIQTFRWLIIIGGLGVAILILHSFIQVKELTPYEEGRASPQPSDQQVFLNKDGQETPFQDYESKYESRLKDILEKVVGVGEVDVMVTIESTEETVVEQNHKDTQQITSEKDQGGATRHVSEITRSGEVVLYEVSGVQAPIVLKKIKPKIRGVVVVAKGAENLVVKQLITQAVQRGLDVPAYRISIVPRKR